MTIRGDDGQYAIDCWLDEADENEPASEFSDNLDELRARALVLLSAGRFRYLVLSRWDAAAGDWVEIDTMEPD